jgi:hypothetical protein
VLDPWADMAAYAENFRKTLTDQKKNLNKSGDRWVWPGVGFLFVTIVGAVSGVPVIVLVGLAGVGVCGWKAYGYIKKIKEVISVMKIYGAK